MHFPNITDQFSLYIFKTKLFLQILFNFFIHPFARVIQVHLPIYPFWAFCQNSNKRFHHSSQFKHTFNKAKLFFFIKCPRKDETGTHSTYTWLLTRKSISLEWFHCEWYLRTTRWVSFRCRAQTEWNLYVAEAHSLPFACVVLYIHV